MMRQLEGNAMNKLSERYIKNRQKQFKKIRKSDTCDRNRKHPGVIKNGGVIS